MCVHVPYGIVLFGYEELETLNPRSDLLVRKCVVFDWATVAVLFFLLSSNINNLNLLR